MDWIAYFVAIGAVRVTASFIFKDSLPNIFSHTPLRFVAFIYCFFTHDLVFQFNKFVFC